MTNNIGSISGGGSSWGVDWSNNSSKKDNVDENQAKEQQANANQERKDINPDDVMRFLANQNIFIPAKVEAKPAADVESVDADTQSRVEEYMKNFEQICAIVSEEFGEEHLPAIMDLVMDKLMGMVS